MTHAEITYIASELASYVDSPHLRSTTWKMKLSDWLADMQTEEAPERQP